MGTLTTHYSLVKPATSDFVDVTQFNANMDTIDTTLFNNAGAITTLQNTQASHTSSINTNTTDIATNTAAISNNDAAAVHLTGAETISGLKTFSTGAKFSAAGMQVSGIAFGNDTVTTDGAGQFAVTHGLGVTPTSVVMTSRNNGTTTIFTLVSKTATTASFRADDAAGNSRTSVAGIGTQWIAIT